MNQLYFFTPYSFQNKLFEAYDSYMNLVPSEQDWACFMDGDTMFFQSNFGHRILQYIKKYPNTGLFTSYASRCFYNAQVPKETNQQNDSIRYHHKIAQTHANFQQTEVKQLTQSIAGHIMVIQKKTWIAIREQVLKKSINETIEGVDTAIAQTIHQINLPILLMKEIYVLHYFRLVEGISYKKHLGYGIRINIITPCSRPENLKAIQQSINIPRTCYKWWIVFDALPNEIDPTLIPENATPIYHKNKKSIAGHAQRNFALDHIPNDNDYVYFLDDDTLMHPDLYPTVAQLLSNDFIHFDQQNPDGTKRIGGKVEINHIDTGSAIVKRQLIENTRFRTDAYNADGIFWKAISLKAQRPLYIPKILSTYNQLNPNQ
jgi:hypothetical protein